MKKRRADYFISKIKHSFQVRVLLSILAPVVVFCIVTNIAISTLLGYQLMEKREEVEKGYLSVIYSYLEDTWDNITTLALLAENSSSVKWAMRNTELNTTEAKRYALAAQSSLSDSLNASPIRDHIDNMVLLNRGGVYICVSASEGAIGQAEQIFQSPLFGKSQSLNEGLRAAVCESVIEKGEKKLVYLYPLDRNNESYIYMELSTDLIEDLLKPYGDSSDIMIRSTIDNTDVWYSSEKFGNQYENGDMKNKTYTEEMIYAPLSLSVAVVMDANLYSSDYTYIIYVLLIAVALVIGAGIAVSRIISQKVTQPLQRLSGHINRMTEEKVLTVDPSIEAGQDEIARIGKEFNRLVRHINGMIKQQKRMYKQKQKLEMDALQAQINPHFLYNTLDSVRWMAVIQDADNIADTVMSLENLLRNMAKGVGNKITLKEELSLAQAYVHLQQVRYMEIFDYICDVPEKYFDYQIVKMTMQPIIENAIFHGIEPTGDYGVIKVMVREADEDLYISIEDNGTGMDQEELDNILKVNQNKNKNSLSGVGIVNVDERLKMTYGSGYGLIYEGEKGKFTKVTIHIPKEKDSGR